ncbi:integral membrane protein GPR137 [Hippocampus comes]|uniref:G protein-coupled receptor 137 n=1 Tax=Hippocampus comes TaxID=109280 RepID=A0A3Q2XEH7_HIPCM|nr:PREDICTED: integral membrane protein GPR137-like [Hippocampus comes]XP_019725363.1 PREDICTED: integral membrane protein GPR137-like [Hippocampus comes]XP_019725364.1 PREDICTED: integral membrane protein GPR137-like [Hippocampus comes]XP_019725365.1 PREDICTED: integral membrane protein GPR137-like [Hippocampus comes]
MEAPVTASPPPYSSTLPVPLPLHPALAPSVQLGFTILYTVLYGGLFLVVYAQLWLLYFYRHKRWSYQSVFLFLCLLWAALRATLFSFYFRNALEANHLPVAVYWLLYCFPVCLQFFTLSLINLYFTQVLLKARETYSSDVEKRLCKARCMYGALNAIFFCVNVSCAALAGRGEGTGPGQRTWNLVLVRVLVNDLLFILDAVLLAVLLLLLTRHSRSTGPYLTSKGTTVCRTAALGATIILLFASRACYNLSVLVLSQHHHVESFDFDWYNVSDQADLHQELGDRGYLAFGVILFIWELLPSSLLILIFRVRRPSQEVSNVAVNNRTLPRPYFFDDPQGNEEEEAPSWASTYQPHSSWYGSETAPLLFASNPPDRSHQHHTFYSTPQN